MATKNKATQNPVIASVVKTAQGATVKVTSDKASFTNEEIISLASDLAQGYIGFTSAKDNLNAIITKAHEGGLRLVDLRGKNKSTPQGKQTQLFKSNFLDNLKSAGIAQATAQSYYELVASGVNKGKAITSTNKKANKAGTNQAGTKAGKGKGKSTKSATKAPSFNDLLLAVHNHTSFKTLAPSTQENIIARLIKAKLLEE